MKRQSKTSLLTHPGVVSLILVIATAVASSLWAQRQVQQPPALASRSQDPPRTLRYPDLASIHVQSTLVEAPVTVIDRSGQFVENLGENDFHVLDNGVPQRIAKFGPALQPVAVVILIQTNKAVEPVLRQVSLLGSMFSALLVGKEGQAAVVCFDDTVRVVQNFTNSPATLDDALKHDMIVGGSNARLNDALGRAIVMLANQPPAERRVILVFSEGFDRGSETSKEEIVRAATAAGITIYGLRFSPTQALLDNHQEPNPGSAPSVLANNMALPGPPGRPQNQANEAVYNQNNDISVLPLASRAADAVRSIHAKDLVQLYAGYTGGVTYSHWKSKELQKQLTRVALEINSQYMLAYAPSTLNQPGFHRLEVEVAQPDVRVRARAGYFYKLKQSK